MFKKSADEHMQRLQVAMEKSWNSMDRFRVHAKKMRDEMAGDMYGERGSARHIYINKIRQASDIYSRLITSGEVRVAVSSPDYPERRPFAEAFTVNLNRRLRECRLSKVGEEVFLAALTGLGVVKTGIAEGDEEYEIDGEFYDVGDPFSELITIDNFIIDMQAESLDKVDYIGDRFRWSKQRIREYFKSDKHKDMGEIRRDEGKFKPEGRTSGVGEDEKAHLYEEGWVWEIYLPKEGIVVTWPADDPEAYMWREWDGPEGGPYEVLGLSWIPGEVLPVAPLTTIYHLHDLINKTMRKLSKQTGRQKVITAYEGDASDDARAIIDADDGEAVRVNNIDGVSQHSFGGPDPQIHNMVIYGSEQADLLAGNLAALGGLAPQSETFKQDAMLQEQASAIVETLRDKTVAFMERIIYRHAWYMWTDPIRDMRTTETRKFNGVEVPVEYSFSPEEKEGDFLEYNFRIDVHSMRKETPAEKGQKLIGLLQQVIMPTGEILMQSGFAPNVVEIIRQVAEYSDIPFDTLLTSMDPEVEMPQRPGEVASPFQGPQNTTRTYERISRPGTTPAGNNKNLMQANLGANPQNAAAASTFSKAV